MIYDKKRTQTFYRTDIKFNNIFLIYSIYPEIHIHCVYFDTTITLLKLHNCFVYFIQKINPWRMIFFILLFFLFYCSGY